MARCYRPDHEAYKYYGGRGIKVCESWKNIKNFAEWAYDNGYEKGLEIDRINTNKGYNPGNCRFVTRKQNMRNTRANVQLTYNGDKKCLIELAEDHNISYKRLAHWYERHGEEYTINCLKTGKVPSTKKKVICVETGKIFESIHEAARQLNLNAQHISHCCNGQSYTHHGYHFEFV